jgi:hypothetical protein
MISFEQRIVVPEDVLMREVAGESVILNLSTETYYSLDEVGTRFWQLLATCETIQQAYAHLADEFDVEAQDLRDDLIALIDDLVQHGLVQLTPA